MNKKTLASLVAIPVLYIASNQIGKYEDRLEDPTYNKVWSHATEIADQNGDGNYRMSPKEFNSIYVDLGLKDTKKKALDLTVEQLEDYISKNKERGIN